MALYMHERSFRAGQVIALAGEPTRAVYLVISGEVRIQRLSPEGREYVFHELGPGQLFNLESALDGGHNLATATASADVVAYAIARDVFVGIVRDRPEMAMLVVQHLTSQVRHLSDAVEDLALHKVRTRLARCLLSRTKRAVPHAGRWTQDELAAQIGTVRDVVGRTLRTFSREGLVRNERGRVVVTDLDGLRREALCDLEPNHIACTIV
jgi:CRP-like cAMP-binding protein